MKRKHKTKTKLYEFGKTIGLEENEIDNAKRMARTVVSMCIIAGIFALVGIFSTRLEAVGMWYGGVSIKDFYLFSGYF